MGLKIGPIPETSVYGEIWVKDNTNPTVLNSAAKVQVTDFANNGESQGTTPDHTNDHITIDSAGNYLVTISMTVANAASQTHNVFFGLFKNNGTVQYDNVHSHRTLQGGSGDIGSITLSGIINVEKNDTVELWANTDAAANRSVIFSDCTLTITKI